VKYACSFILIDGIFRFLRRKPRVVFALLVINHRNRSSVSNIIQRLKRRPLADRRKDARLVMLYTIVRELVAINKENRLIPTG
jgi:predicted transcriptional regulator